MPDRSSQEEGFKIIPLPLLGSPWLDPLYAGETVLRMRLTGAAPPATSVLTAFDLAAPAQRATA
jgi:hypothetical protein